MFGCFLFLEWLDMLTTLIGLANKGIGYEANPIVQFVVLHFGIEGFILLKLFALILLFYLYPKIPVFWQKVGVYTMGIVVSLGIFSLLNG